LLGSLLLAPGDKSAIYLGKLVGNLALMLVVEALVLGLFVVFFDIDSPRAARPARVVLPRHARAAAVARVRGHDGQRARARAALSRPAAARPGAGALLATEGHGGASARRAARRRRALGELLVAARRDLRR